MYSMVFCTCGSKSEAENIAATLVEERLAACVQLLPIQSVYRWQGAIEQEDEILLFIKTRSDLFDPVAKRIRELHSYEVPEIIQTPITDGLPAYLNWIVDSTMRS